MIAFPIARGTKTQNCRNSNFPRAKKFRQNARTRVSHDKPKKRVIALRLLGKLWNYLEMSGRFWNCMEEFEVIWKDLDSFKTVRKALRSSGNILTVLKPSGKFSNNSDLYEAVRTTLKEYWKFNSFFSICAKTIWIGMVPFYRGFCASAYRQFRLWTA